MKSIFKNKLVFALIMVAFVAACATAGSQTMQLKEARPAADLKASAEINPAPAESKPLEAAEEVRQPAAQSSPASPVQDPPAAISASEKTAVRVGFDIDDTLLFSTPAFIKGNESGAAPYSDMFWSIVNGADSGNSIVKEKAMEVLEMHRARGDEIFIITARATPNSQALKTYISETFSVPEQNIFFEPKGKGERIRQLKMNIYYGDSDSDISDAIEAGAKGVRILRSPESSYKSKYNPGMFGEEIIPDSEK